MEATYTRGMLSLFGGAFEAQWSRLTPPMRAWLAKLSYLLPICPWGRQGGGGGGGVVLELVCLELLSKARLLWSLFERGAESVERGCSWNAAAPFSLEKGSCPYARKPALDAADARTHSAALFLLAPVQPAAVRSAYPQLLLLNGEGVGGELREKLGSRLATRLLVSQGPTPICGQPRWVLVPACYTAEIADATLAKLGGPRRGPQATASPPIICLATTVTATVTLPLTPYLDHYLTPNPPPSTYNYQP